MAISTKNILAAEDWRQIYQTFKEADFQSYDFVTLRKTMIEYLRLHYPEDFNDFIESSEYIALIDLIAYLGQNLAYRTDLNTRENFLDTAERRDSVLKLARLISYNPKRTIPASGFLKIDSVTTTETLYDSNDIQITNTPIYWNDPTNDNWHEQFTMVLNASMVDSQQVGKPGNSQRINGVDTEEYSINLTTTTIPTFGYTASINGSNMKFEIISATSKGESYIYEVPPKATQLFNVLYRNDNNGNSSNNTGFFLHFKQGEIKTESFTMAEALPNRVVSIATPSINNNDVWLYSLSTAGTVVKQWTAVPAISGMNIIYNKEVERDLYQIVTRPGDQIDLVFGDGSFSNVPKGNFSLYYRVSDSASYKISPEEMQNVRVSMNYVSRIGRVETLTITASLKYTVSNAVPRESIESIRRRAPQQFYTQNRMITGEDYNLFPYATYSNILKVRALNRTSSGISRYLDIIDPTGKYSSTDIYADDGVFYKDEIVKKLRFSFSTTTEAFKHVNETITKIVSLQEYSHFYYAKYPRYKLENLSWSLVNVLTKNESNGFFATGQIAQQIGYFVGNNRKYIRPGAIIKFIPPSGYYFDNLNSLVRGTPATPESKMQLYACVMAVDGDGIANGTGVYADGTASVYLNIRVPTGSVAYEVIPPLKTEITPNDITTLFSGYINRNKNFGLAYDYRSQQWVGIAPEDLNLTSPFDLATFGSTTSKNENSAWSIAFVYDGLSTYSVYYRTVDYVFESAGQVKFYFDENLSVYDSKIARTITDQIKILSINPVGEAGDKMDSDLVLNVYKNITGTDGYDAINRIYVSYPNVNYDTIPDNPDIFNIFVESEPSIRKKLVFFKIQDTTDSFISEVIVPSDKVITTYDSTFRIETDIYLFQENQVFYLIDKNEFYVVKTISGVKQVVKDDSYVARIGRDKIHFQYKHNSPNHRRIDPSPANIIDLYVLTKNYNDDYRLWIQDTTGNVVEPLAPTTYDLSVEFAGIDDYKPVSDTIIFNAAKFRPLFGNKAEEALQATFKVVKNKTTTVSDNDVKSRMILEINNYFSASNRDLGETFYFSELSAYLHSVMGNIISSVIIMPKASTGYFGGLYQINAEPGEILISCATVDDIDIIDSVTLSVITAG